jgi:hypothetical protein
MATEPAIALTQATSPSSTSIVSLSTHSLPFTGMPAVVQYLAYHYSRPYAVSSGVTIAGEFAVVRIDSHLQKAYDYVFGTGPTGLTVFVGPFKNFDAHHTSIASSVDIHTVFGHHPWMASGGSGLTSA